VPPTIWLSKSRKVLSWCIYTTTLEPILAKMSEKRKVAARFARGIPTSVALHLTAASKARKNCFLN